MVEIQGINVQYFLVFGFFLHGVWMRLVYDVSELLVDPILKGND
jgi:hypothetical protein